MNPHEDSRELSQQIEELTEKLQTLSDKQNSQYTDIMMLLKKIEEKIDNPEGADDRTEDELYEAALKVVKEAGKASTSYLQRRLKIGYAQAARLLDKLEENGIISPADGAKPREILTKNF